MTGGSAARRRRYDLTTNHTNHTNMRRESSRLGGSGGSVFLGPRKHADERGRDWVGVRVFPRASAGFMGSTPLRGLRGAHAPFVWFVFQSNRACGAGVS
jgi:hypothetical protein